MPGRAGEESCPFCRIVRGETSAVVVREEADLLAIEDAAPQAPVHILVIPRRHIATVGDLTGEDGAMVGRMILLARAVAREKGVDRGGYRLVMNCGRAAGQSVWHLHLHVLGGRLFHWPPG